MSFFILLLIRIVANIPIPLINSVYKQQLLLNQNGAFDFYNLLTGGGLEQLSIFSLGVTPYITASILLQLATIVFPSLEDFYKSGGGKDKLESIIKKFSFVLGFLQAFGMAFYLARFGVLRGDYKSLIVGSIILLTSSAILIGLGNFITEYGVGNGISLILVTNVLSRLPRDLMTLFSRVTFKNWHLQLLSVVLIVLFLVVIVVLTLLLSEAVRKIPIQYTSNIRGRKGKEYIPLKVNVSNVVPVLFASSLLAIPAMAIAFSGVELKGLSKSLYLATFQDNWFILSSWKLSLGYLIYIMALIYFAYFYTEITFNSSEIAYHLKRRGGFLSSIQSGVDAEECLNQILKPVTFIGSSGLAMICTFPMILSGIFDLKVSFLGTSLIIATSVIVETYKQIKSYYNETLNSL